MNPDDFAAKTKRLEARVAFVAGEPGWREEAARRSDAERAWEKAGAAIRENAPGWDDRETRLTEEGLKAINEGEA